MMHEQNRAWGRSVHEQMESSIHTGFETHQLLAQELETHCVAGCHSGSCLAKGDAGGSKSTQVKNRSWSKKGG